MQLFTTITGKISYKFSSEAQNVRSAVLLSLIQKKTLATFVVFNNLLLTILFICNMICFISVGDVLTNIFLGRNCWILHQEGALHWSEK